MANDSLAELEARSATSTALFDEVKQAPMETVTRLDNLAQVEIEKKKVLDQIIIAVGVKLAEIGCSLGMDDFEVIHPSGGAYSVQYHTSREKKGYLVNRDFWSYYEYFKTRLWAVEQLLEAVRVRLGAFVEENEREVHRVQALKKNLEEITKLLEPKS